MISSAIIQMIKQSLSVVFMATLCVRKVNEDTYQQLRSQAAAHGISMEEEVRRILINGVTPMEKPSVIFARYFGKHHGVLLNISRDHDKHPPQDFGNDSA